MGEACRFETTIPAPINFLRGFDAQPIHPWFALKVRAGSEAGIVQILADRGLQAYVPTHKERRRYSDRMKVVETPLFHGYVFCSFNVEKKLSVISCPGVDYIVGFGGVPAAIPRVQIESVRRIVAAGAVACERFTQGDRVRVTHGALAGVEGILVHESAGNRLVVSIDLLNRGVSLLVDKDHVSLSRSAA